MATMKRIPVSLPKPLKDKLTALRSEGYSVAGYLRHLAEVDIRAREEAGWRAGKGWNGAPHRIAPGRPYLPYPKHLHRKPRKGRSGRKPAA